MTMPGLRTLVVTGADEGFAGLLRGLIESLRQWQSPPYTDLACFDVGLAASTRDWVAERAKHVVVPEWDLPVDDAKRRAQPHLRALTVRPFLPRYFPGYDIYVWIDADAWVQEGYAIEACVAGAAEGSIAIASHSHPCYQYRENVISWARGRRKAYFGIDASEPIPLETYWNAGVFALAAGAPHWDTWRQYFERGLARTAGKICCDQTALHQAIAVEHLPVARLSAHCNWICRLALPVFDMNRSRYCDPLDRKTVLGILHLVGNAKKWAVQLPGDKLGRTVDLRYPPELKLPRTKL